MALRVTRAIGDVSPMSGLPRNRPWRAVHAALLHEGKAVMRLRCPPYDSHGQGAAPPAMNEAAGGVNAANCPAAESQVLGARREGGLPHLVALLVEDQPRVGRCRDPGAALELAFELARAPAGIAEGHEAFLRTAA